MAKWKAKYKFSTTVVVDGHNVYVVCDKGDTIDLEPQVAELVNRDCPDVLQAATVKKPEVKATAKGKTRQVAAAPARGKGKVEDAGSNSS